jgi:hypothetical protein
MGYVLLFAPCAFDVVLISFGTRRCNLCRSLWETDYDIKLVRSCHRSIREAVVYLLLATNIEYGAIVCIINLHPISKVHVVPRCGLGRGAAFTPYNDRLKRLRRLMHKVLTPDVVTMDFQPLIESEMKAYLSRLFLNPEHFVHHLRRMATSVIMNVVYGYHLDADDDPFARLVERVFQVLSICTRPGAFLVDFVPACPYSYHISGYA